MPNEHSSLSERYDAVMERLAAAIKSSGRARDDVTLVAVSKYHPAESIAALAALGHRDFGENYIQEALTKQDDLAELGLSWHFIGRLQSNKAKLAAGKFRMIHTLDSIKLAHTLHKHAEALAQRQESVGRQAVLIQVNVGQEAQKAGVDADELAPLAEAVMDLPSLELSGLMCLPPVFEGPEESRPYFVQLREARDRLRDRLGLALPHLSMGMSHDFEAAVAEGATMVRVGTDIFGPRPAKA